MADDADQNDLLSRVLSAKFTPVTFLAVFVVSTVSLTMRDNIVVVTFAAMALLTLALITFIFILKYRRDLLETKRLPMVFPEHSQESKYKLAIELIPRDRCDERLTSMCQATKAQTLFASVGDASWLMPWIERTCLDKQIRIGELVIVHLDYRVASIYQKYMQDSGLKEPRLSDQYLVNLRNNISSIRSNQHVIAQKLRVTERSWRGGIPPLFHGFMYGDKILINTWAQRNGEWHVGNPFMYYSTRSSNPKEYEEVKRIFMDSTKEEEVASHR